MSYSTHRTFFRCLIPLAIGLLLAEQLHAQGTRPGSAQRGTTGGGGGTTRSSAGTGTRGSTGQRQYRSNTELGDAMIQIDPETRSLVIVTDEDTHRELANVIKSLDKPKPQVLIKVVFLQVTYNNALDVGIEGTYTANLRNPTAATTGSQVVNSTRTRGTEIDNGTRTTTSTLTTPLGDAATLGNSATVQSLYGLAAMPSGNFIRLVSDDWTATLRLLSQKGKTEVLSRPSIMARNNQEAVIVVGQEVPFITSSRITDAGDTINTIQYDNVGIILRVTPFITDSGAVEMIVAPEISTLNRNETVPITNTVNAPTIDKRSAETVVVTPHGQTVVIGGLMETQKVETVRKIPILGDIPFIGIPFRHTIKEDRKRELLIFLTPFIVNDAAGITRETEGELQRAELVDKAFSTKDLNKFIDGLPMPSDGENPKQPAATPAPKRAKPAPTPAKTKAAGVIKTSTPKTSSR